MGCGCRAVLIKKSTADDPLQMSRRGVGVRFRRDLGFLDVTMIGLGPTIGTTIFLLVGPGFAITGPSLILAFALNFVITLFTAMAYMELGSAFPETGGGYLWVSKAMKEPFGFLGGWMSWFGHSIVAAFYIFGFGLGAVVMLKAYTGTDQLTLGGLGEDALIKIFAITAAAVFIALNYRGTRITGRSEVAVTLVLLGIVVVFILFALAFLLRGPFSWESYQPFFRGDSGWTQFVALLAAMGFTFIVFEGYEIIAQTGEECRDPEVNIPRASFLVIGLSTVIFVLVAFVSIGVGGGCVATRPEDPCLLVSTGGGTEGNESGIIGIASLVMPLGLPLVVLGVVLGALAATNSLIFSASRVSFAMAREGALPRALSRMHRERRTPHVSIVASGLLIVTLAFVLDIRSIAASADIMFLLLFLQVNWAAIVLRRKMPHVKRYYMMPLFPLIPLAGIATKFVLAVSLWTVEPLAWFIALGWLGLGLGTYFLYRKRERVAEVVKAVESVLPRPFRRYRILLPLDDFRRSELVDFASLVAQVEQAELTLLHVIEIPTGAPLRAVDRSHIVEARDRLARLRRRAETFRISVTARVEVARSVPTAIRRITKEEETSLLILGWRGGRRKGRTLGRDVDSFVRRAPCDVVVFKSANIRRKLKKIVVMNAPGWHVSYATGYAVLLARRDGARVTLLSAAKTQKELDRERAYGERLAAICRTHGVRYGETYALTRDIPREVVRVSKAHDLLVLGASEARVRTRFVFGTLQDKIARATPAPVLMVRKVVSRPLPRLGWRRVLLGRLLRPTPSS